MWRKTPASVLSRRAFMASAPIVAAGLPALAASAGQENRPQPRLKVNLDLFKYVHPAVRYRRVELPEEKNAYPLWLKAGRMLKDIEEFLPQLVDDVTEEERSRVAEACYDAFDEGRAFPTGQAADVLRRWLKANQAAMKLVAAGLARGRLQFPERLLTDLFEETDGAVDPVTTYREFSRLILLQAKLRIAERDYQAAGAELARIWRLGEMVVESEGCLFHHLMGVALKSMGNEGARDMARNHQVPTAVVRALKQKLKRHYPTQGQFAQTLRVEFCYFALSEIGRLPDDVPLEDLVDALIKQFVLLGQSDPKNALTTEEKVSQLRKGLLRLLHGHPAPLDKADTVRIFSREMAALIADLGTPYLKRNREIGKSIAREVEAWPGYLDLESELTLLKQDPEDQKPPSAEDLERAHRALLAVKNPVGKQLASSVRDFDQYRAVLPRHFIETAATEVVLAVRLYIDRRRQLPKSLQALVDEKLLTEVPEDPFAGKPLSYSREKAIIWSYGHDEKDDGGDWDWEAEFPTGKDFVWKLPRC